MKDVKVIQIIIEKVFLKLLRISTIFHNNFDNQSYFELLCDSVQWIVKAIKTFLTHYLFSMTN